MELKELVKHKEAETAVKGKPSALIVTIVLHAILFFASGVFVAVQIATTPKTEIVGKKFERPKMQLKKLQVPVKIEQQSKQPKINQRVVSSSKVKTKSIDFKMPELSGIGGGSAGVNVSGISLAGSLGFQTTQLNLFGLKSRGENILFVLDTTRTILADEIGGIAAYKIIKNELAALIGRLPPTALFNVVVFDNKGCRAFSKDMSRASEENVKKLKSWLAPLNSKINKYGLETLGSQGTTLYFDPIYPIPNEQNSWIAALTYAIQKNVDNMYWLGAQDDIDWIHKDFLDSVKNGKPLSDPSGRYPTGADLSKYPGGPEAWMKKVAEAQKLYDKENRERLARGEPMRVITGSGNDTSLVKMYFPAGPFPVEFDEGKTRYKYTADNVMDYIAALQKKIRGKGETKVLAGLKGKKLAINVVHFVPKSTAEIQTAGLDFELESMQDVARKTGGSYLKIQGMDQIKSSATADSSEVIFE